MRSLNREGAPVKVDAEGAIKEKNDLHKVVLEEVLQLSLSGRISEVSNVKSSALSSACDDSLVLRCVDGLVGAGSNASTFGGSGGLVEGSVCHLGGGSFDGHDEDCSLVFDDTEVRRVGNCGVLVEP